MKVDLYIISDLPLKKTVKVDVHFNGNYFIVTNKDFEIFMGDTTLPEALRHFCEFFIDDYKNFANILAEKHYPGAFDILSKYKEYIDE